MSKAKVIVISVLACLSNADVRKAIYDKNYELKCKPLSKFKEYLAMEEFKKMTVTEENFNQCVMFVITKMENEKFRNYLAKNDICSLVFYEKTVTGKPKNLFDEQAVKYSQVLSSLRGIVVKYQIDDSVITIYTNPVSIYKNRLMESSEHIINHCNNNGENVSNIEVKYIHKNNPISEEGEALLHLGFVIE